mgnify:CR=1 FL=1
MCRCGCRHRCGARAAADAAVAAAATTAAAAAVATAAAEVAAANVARCIVHAPFNGRVASRNVGTGQVVSPAIVLSQLQSIDFAEVRLALPLKEFGFLEMDLRNLRLS